MSVSAGPSSLSDRPPTPAIASPGLSKIVRQLTAAYRSKTALVGRAMLRQKPGIFSLYYLANGSHKTRTPSNKRTNQIGGADNSQSKRRRSERGEPARSLGSGGASGKDDGEDGSHQLADAVWLKHCDLQFVGDDPVPHTLVSEFEVESGPRIRPEDEHLFVILAMQIVGVDTAYMGFLGNVVFLKGSGALEVSERLAARLRIATADEDCDLIAQKSISLVPNQRPVLVRESSENYADVPYIGKAIHQGEMGWSIWWLRREPGSASVYRWVPEDNVDGRWELEYPLWAMHKCGFVLAPPDPPDTPGSEPNLFVSFLRRGDQMTSEKVSQYVGVLRRVIDRHPERVQVSGSTSKELEEDLTIDEDPGLHFESDHESESGSDDEDEDAT